MLPGGINPKQMKQMMKKLGMQVEQIEDVREIIIITPKGRYIFDTAEVSAMTMQGVTTYQIVGEPRFEESAPEIPKDDVSLVAGQTGATEEAAKTALTETKGDIAEAIMRLSTHD
ncbi:MAG TPA: nascent polypeptide-associated complex protein [Methanoregulaceae archaeon]|nr:nascent polypeptide-associated complex protein [Methanoregulaceae archaeon]